MLNFLRSGIEACGEFTDPSKIMKMRKCLDSDEEEYVRGQERIGELKNYHKLGLKNYIP
jgi:hypothetical protein